ncbi:hypothetical protein SISNIDRAFT_464724 [Sistotremastrum niveocremeum HHB9708]|uniref:Uncharacterized protein n=1 Tax=Sistotremastrum niveocremeum HHB9708 TaxID=1314777 RepID=A0A164WHR2_9AGAM|nr:hypothetical protein SISNIDRAFT_464724 [Sistotremastrum niveocremeum HHB9708]
MSLSVTGPTGAEASHEVIIQAQISLGTRVYVDYRSFPLDLKIQKLLRYRRMKETTSKEYRWFDLVKCPFDFSASQSKCNFNEWDLQGWRVYESRRVWVRAMNKFALDSLFALGPIKYFKFINRVAGRAFWVRPATDIGLRSALRFGTVAYPRLRISGEISGGPSAIRGCATADSRALSRIAEDLRIIRG